jgi:large conductance mechanosensitive channel
MSKFFNEFKQFAVRGDVIQLAVGVILGTAINSVAKSLASDIFSPIIGLFIGKINLSNLKIIVPSEYVGESLIISYGAFLQSLLDFIVTAFCIFIMIKFVKKISKFSIKKVKDAVIGDSSNEETDKSEAELSDNTKVTEENNEELNKTDALLIEIRDLLKAQNATPQEISELKDSFDDNK